MGIPVPDSLLHSGLIQQKLPANSGHGFADFFHLNVIGGFLGYSQDLPAFVFTSPHPEYCSYMFRRFLTDPTFLALNVHGCNRSPVSSYCKNVLLHHLSLSFSYSFSSLHIRYSRPFCKVPQCVNNILVRTCM